MEHNLTDTTLTPPPHTHTPTHMHLRNFMPRCPGAHGNADGEFYGPTALALVPDLGLFVRERYNHRFQVFARPGRSGAPNRYPSAVSASAGSGSITTAASLTATTLGAAAQARRPVHDKAQRREDVEEEGEEDGGGDGGHGWRTGATHPGFNRDGSSDGDGEGEGEREGDDDDDGDGGSSTVSAQASEPGVPTSGLVVGLSGGQGGVELLARSLAPFSTSRGGALVSAGVFGVPRVGCCMRYVWGGEGMGGVGCRVSL